MIYRIYTIQDTLIGFNAPFIMRDDEIAKREYRNFLKSNPNSADMRLYYVGDFNDETGECEGVVPEQIMGGE